MAAAGLPAKWIRKPDTRRRELVCDSLCEADASRRSLSILIARERGPIRDILVISADFG
jgi:hypothetical protein